MVWKGQGGEGAGGAGCVWLVFVYKGTHTRGQLWACHLKPVTCALARPLPW